MWLRVLESIARVGVQAHTKAGFTPNKGLVDQVRPQYWQYRTAIHHSLSKLQRAGKCLLLDRELVMDTVGLHVSAIHVVVKPGEEKVRVCTDAAASDLNIFTDMEAVSGSLGRFELPNTPHLARMLDRASKSGRKFLYKTDVSGAFINMMLSLYHCGVS